MEIKQTRGSVIPATPPEHENFYEMNNMMHSIIFDSDDKGSMATDFYYDLGLVPTSRPSVNPPEVITNKLQIPGANGVLDLSRVLTDFALYSNRTGSWEFVCIPQDNDAVKWATFGWAQQLQKIMNALHGKVGNIVLDDEEPYYSDMPMDARRYFYHGTLSVSGYSSEKDFSKVTIDYNFDPYARSKDSVRDLYPNVFVFKNVTSTEEPYFPETDPYTGEKFYLHTYFRNSVNPVYYIDIPSPTIQPIVSVIGDPVKVRMGGREQTFTEGTHNAYRFVIPYLTDTNFYVSGNGKSKVMIYWYNRRL